jgi:hypothetical protein
VVPAIAVVAACLFGLIASVAMTRASNLSPAWNLVLGGAFVLALALTLLAIVIFTGRGLFNN